MGIKDALKGKTKTADSIVSVFDNIVTSGLEAKAKVVLSDFVRKDDERQSNIASINNSITGLEGDLTTAKDKLEAATKVTNQAAIARTITGIEANLLTTAADVTEIETLRTAAAEKRAAFIKAFDTDAYAALANTDLVRSGLKFPKSDS